MRREVDFGDALTDGDGVGLLFLAERSCRRWLGVGVGVAKNFFIFSPNEGSSALAPDADARAKRKTESSALSNDLFAGLNPQHRPLPVILNGVKDFAE